MTVRINQYHIGEHEILKDAEAILEAQKDISAFSYLYDTYYIRIFRFIYNRVESEDIAADITSQVFLKAMQNINKYTHKGLPYASYLYRLARNEINQEARNNKIKTVSSTQQSNLEDITDELEVDKEFNYQIFIKLLESLEEKDLELIEMKYFEKRSYKEMSQILDIKENNLKVKVHRIIEKLRQKVNTTVIAVLVFLILTIQ